jgi:hypothetical protein
LEDDIEEGGNIRRHRANPAIYSKQTDWHVMSCHNIEFSGEKFTYYESHNAPHLSSIVAEAKSAKAISQLDETRDVFGIP